MNPVFGLHVGNSVACLAIYKQDDFKEFVEVVVNNAGDRVMHAVVTVTESENVVGAACKSLMVSRWNTTVIHNKQMFDRNTPMPENSIRRAKTILRDGELCYELPLENGIVYRTPDAIASCLYRTLYDMAKSAVHGEDNDISCVLMVPKHFSEEARFKVRTVAEAAGWDVLHVINEPSAAILGYNILSDKTPPPNQKILVYRVGGVSCDVTVIDLNYGMMTILDSEHSEEVGGKLLISTLTKYLADEFYRKYKLDPKESHRSYMKLSQAAENCLHVLSTIESANCFVESLCEGVDFSHNMSRARFESLLFPYLADFTKPLHTLLARLNLSPDNVSTVLLCGGPLKIPRLKKYVSAIFQESTTKITSLPNGINYDEVLACGAARQAGYIVSDKSRDNFLPSDIDVPVLENPLTVQVEGGESDGLVLEAGQPLPTHRTLRVTSPSDKVTLSFTQAHPDSPQLVLKGEIELVSLENPTDLELEIDSESGIKVRVSGCEDRFAHEVVEMFSQPVL